MRFIVAVVLSMLTVSWSMYPELAAATVGSLQAVVPSRSELTAAQPDTSANRWGLPDDPLLGFVEIPAGEFIMGSGSQDTQADDDERPQHTVTLPTYLIGRNEVTVAQFAVFVADAGYDPDNPTSLEGPVDYPVRNVSWADVVEYCAWLTERLRGWAGTPSELARRLRGSDGGPRWRVNLPSEAEWEKAARGSDGRLYPWGNRVDETRANYGGTGGPTHAPGAAPPRRSVNAPGSSCGGGGIGSGL